MKTFIRILSFILLIGTTVIFVLKVRINIPVSYTHLFVGFVVGVISLLWTNIKEIREHKRQFEMRKGKK